VSPPSGCGGLLAGGGGGGGRGVGSQETPHEAVRHSSPLEQLPVLLNRKRELFDALFSSWRFEVKVFAPLACAGLFTGTNYPSFKLFAFSMQPPLPKTLTGGGPWHPFVRPLLLLLFYYQF